MSNEQERESQELIPTVQDTIIFNGNPLVVVRLPDGRPGVVLRGICENLKLGPAAQVERIKRTEVIANDLVYVQVETEGGLQKIPTLVFRAVPFWLAGINPSRTSPDMRPIILAYQREVVDVLYAWASTPRVIASPSRAAVPAEPSSPAQDSPALAWAEYHRQMVAFYEWKAATDTRIDVIEERQVEIESRLDEHRRVLAFIPDILERLGPELITIGHQRSVQGLVKHLHDATGKPFGAIYDELKTAFEVPRYQEIREQDWDKVLSWFQMQLDKAKRN
ncbi:MAG: phage antirepressor N-terminal domain-containing protein [Ktedonobacteraceae bacterium]